MDFNGWGGNGCAKFVATRPVATRSIDPKSGRCDLAKLKTSQSKFEPGEVCSRARLTIQLRLARSEPPPIVAKEADDQPPQPRQPRQPRQPQPRQPRQPHH